MRRLPGVVVAAACALLLILGACAPAAPGDKSGGQPSPTPVPARYASTSFLVPFEVTLPVGYPATPQTDAPNFVTWESQGVAPIRFLQPLSVYPPGTRRAASVPTDYLDYLLGQASVGGHFDDRKDVTIDGLPATLVTATTDEAHNGSIGCWKRGQVSSECFGVQLALSLRMAVLTVRGKTLVIWLRQPVDADPQVAARRIADFEAMLGTIRFT